MARIDGLSDETKEMLVERRPPGMTWDEFFTKSYEEGVPAYLPDAVIDELAVRTARETLAGASGYRLPRRKRSFGTLDERLQD